MSVTLDILRTWRSPRMIIRRHLDQGRREDRALAFVMAACFIIFVAQWPRLSRLAAGFDLPQGVEAPELSQMVAYEFLGWLMVWPLMFYVIAALFHVIAKALAGKGSFYSARLALFWSLLATTPIALLHGLCAGFLGAIASTQLVGVIWLGALLVIFAASFYEAEQRPEG